MATREYFTWWLDACRHRHLSPADALDDPRLDDQPDDIPQTTSQPRDALRLPVTCRRGRDTRLDIQRHVHGGRGRGPNGEPQRSVGAMDSEQEEEFGDPEYAPSGQVDPDVGFLATVSGSQIEGIASRYQGIRDARITQHVAPIYPPLQSTAPDMSWIPPWTPPSTRLIRGFWSLPGHQFGTPPSWEYQPMQSGSGSSSTHPVHDMHPPPAPTHYQVIRPRPRSQRQPPLCGTSSHLQHPPPQ
ncbi:hypothetical protein PIB30_076867 [Stylosanthes scabra]|uniref:Uncharacterized protein n=1 Tax=Stylosanthes scabra TaxID=79078 RepID=A0ABU6US78_9FABA|nr:hypothetical protein [Stylosanthes scabra]